MQTGTSFARTPESQKPAHLMLLAAILGKLPGITGNFLNPHEFTREDLEHTVMAAVKEDPDIFSPEFQQMCVNTHLPLLVRYGFVERIGTSLCYSVTSKGQLATFDYEVAA